MVRNAHYQEVCQFGSVHAQCRCPSPSKAQKTIECPSPANCERRNIGQVQAAKNLKQLVTIDLDSTLANTGHRHHIIDRENGTDWDAYSLACVEDLPIMGMVKTVQLLHQLSGIEVHALSGRGEIATQQTLDWLAKHDVPIKKVHLARHASVDYHPGWTHADYKLARLREVEEETGMKVVLHFDDWAEVAVKLEENGIPCVCVRTPQEIEELVASDHERGSV